MQSKESFQLNRKKIVKFKEKGTFTLIAVLGECAPDEFIADGAPRRALEVRLLPIVELI